MASVHMADGTTVEIPDWCAEDEEYLPSKSVFHRHTEGYLPLSQGVLNLDLLKWDQASFRPKVDEIIIYRF